MWWVAAAALAQQPLVVGGDIAPEGAWPDAAAVLRDGIAVCTGVLIAPDVVLTAGHCGRSGAITSVKVNAPNWVTLGEEIDVAGDIPYPQWGKSYDARLLLLAEEATVEPRRIARGCILDDHLEVGAPVAIVGYGATEPDGGGITFALHEAFTTVTDPDCDAVGRGCREEISPGGEIGAGGDGIDACFGDSGGPLYLLTPRGDHLVGITSRAWARADPPCQHGGIYVRPDALVDWIEEEAGITLPGPICGYPPDPPDPTLEITGRRGVLRVDPNDPDAGDSHVFEVVTPPGHGTAEVAGDGALTYRAERGFAGVDALVVRVTDDSEWSMSGDAEVAVIVNEGCGCDTSHGGVGWVALCWLPWLRRRRR